MSLIRLQGNASGTGAFTIAAPNGNTDRTLTLPDATGTVNVSGLANEVPAGSAGAPAIYPTGDSNTGIFFPAADTIAFSEGGVESMRIDSAGNVGIGTTSPSNRLHVQNEITTAYSSANTLAAAPLAYFYNTNGSVGGAGTIRIDGGTSGGNGAVTISALQTASGSSALTFGTRSGGSDVAERARIDSSGVLTVGQTSSINVFSGSADGCSIEGDGAISLSRNQNASLYIRRRGNNGAVAAFLRDTTQVGRIDVTTTATAYVTSSDYRLKENVAPMQNALDTVAQLNPVTYTWKADGSAGQGFIAHELQAVVPDCVTGEKDAVDETGNPQYQGVDTSFLVATLVKAIQELTARVAELEAN
jgi:hypothetical protein